MTKPPVEPLYTTQEVAGLFRVGPNTVLRWAVDGQIPSILLPGGQRRYRVRDIDPMLRPPGTRRDLPPRALGALAAVVRTYFGGNTDAAAEALTQLATPPDDRH